MNDEYFMREALSMARSAECLGEVPVGAIVVRDGGDAVGIRIVCISVATGLWVRECEVSVFRVQAQYSIDASARHLQREQKGGDKVEDGAKSGHVN